MEERVLARWDALIKGDFPAAYAYVSPASKDVYSLQRYRNSYARGTFRSVKIENVACPDQSCEVNLLLTYDHPKMKGLVSPVKERWVWSDGQAWFVVLE